MSVIILQRAWDDTQDFVSKDDGQKGAKTQARSQQGEQGEESGEEVAESGLAEVQRFAKGLERDKEAVLAGLTVIHSNGQVEGQVNKLKLIKRQGYGKAGFPLLRQRVLHAL